MPRHDPPNEEEAFDVHVQNLTNVLEYRKPAGHWWKNPITHTEYPLHTVTYENTELQQSVTVVLQPPRLYLEITTENEPPKYTGHGTELNMADLLAAIFKRWKRGLRA